MARFFYCLYQLCIALPLILVLTILTALTTIVGCTIGSDRVFGYYPGRAWSWCVCRLLLLPVHVKGRERLNAGQSYVFVTNHQGTMDIFLVYGFLGRSFKWMMKQSLRKIPLVGYACQKAGFIFVDRGNRKRLRATMAQAERALHDGMSLVVFPEGTRSKTGEVGHFHKGAFQIAEELNHPVVPMTISGSFRVLPASGGLSFARRHALRLTIHEPIFPRPEEEGDAERLMEQAREAILSACGEPPETPRP